MKRIVLAAVAAVTLASCSLLPFAPDDESATPSPTPEAGSTIDNGAIVTGIPTDPFSSPVYQQQVTWTECGDLECASIEVPLDWSEPDGPTIMIAMNRRPADDPGSRVGSLLLNPGGPGASGMDLLEYFAPSAGERLLASYDLIGFDPRGTGESSPIDCGDGSTLDEYYVQDFAVESQADLDEARAINEEFAAGCREHSGRLIANVDTVSVARDMDVIRAVLGDEKLHYLGFSYGTQLGATYAEIYPDHVGRLVLDGAVDILLPAEEQSARQAEGFENALGNFITWCLKRESCPLSGDAENARKQIAQVALTARDEPYVSGGKVLVNGNLMVYGIVVTLYDEASWEYLELALTEAIEDETAQIFYELANFYLDRDGQSGEYLGNSTVAFTAINCLDAEDEDWTIKQQQDFARMMEQASPTFGWWFSSGTGCEGWPFTADEKVTSLDRAKTAPTMLVIGTTNDPATPYSWAVSLASHLNGALLTYDGEGHTAYGRSNQCIIDAVDAYLVDGVLPPDGTKC